MVHEYRDILFDVPEPAIARITLNRPDKLNAYTGRMCTDIVRALDEYVERDDLRCLILTGAGRGFCSGGDVSGSDPDRPDYRTKQLGYGHEMRVGMHRVVLALHHIDKPVIAMINGAAVAGGLTLALACDFRIAADTAKLGDTSGKFGLLPDEGGVWLFPRFMGLDHALKMTLLSEVYSAREAHELGLITEVVPAAELEIHTTGVARAIAKKAPLAVRLAKSMMRHGLTSSLEHSLNDTALSVMIANPSEDVREGVSAFFAKREPNFRAVNSRHTLADSRQPGSSVVQVRPSNHVHAAGCGAAIPATAQIRMRYPMKRKCAIMKRVTSYVLAGSSVLLLAACATTPPGPMIPVMPGPNKSPAAFTADQNACMEYAANAVQGHVQEAQNHQVVNGVIGGAIGAGIGAAAAHSAATGAAIGGGIGALLGSTAGAGWEQGGVQQHYDMAYASCMTSRGNRVPGPPPHRPRWYWRHGYAPPPPPGYGPPPPPPDESGPPPDDRGPPSPPPSE